MTDEYLKEKLDDISIDVKAQKRDLLNHVYDEDAKANKHYAEFVVFKLEMKDALHEIKLDLQKQNLFRSMALAALSGLVVLFGEAFFRKIMP